MATDEEYLDNLLKSLTENEEQSGTSFAPEEETAPIMPEPAPGIESMPEDMAAFFDTVMNGDKESGASDTRDAAVGMDESEDAEEKSGVTADENMGFAMEDEEWQNNLDALLASAAGQETGTLQEDNAFNSAESVREDKGADEELKELDGLLNSQATSGTAVDDDMLALLESMQPQQEEEEKEEAPETLDMGATFMEKEEAEETDKKKKNKKKERKAGKEKKTSLFGRKKKEETAQEEAEAVPAAPLDESPAEKPEIEDEILALAEEGADKPIEAGEQKEKKPGAFARFLQFITEEDEEEEDLTEEGQDSSEEEKLSKKEQKKKEKEEKKQQKKEKKKGKKGGNAEEGKEEDEEEQPLEEDPKKKEKREKKEQKRLAREQEKALEAQQPKVLSRRKLMTLIAACATLTAGIVILSWFLPEYADKNSAREAYYERDYETAYKLLYDKNLNASDRLLFNRAETVLRLTRKLESYENNLAMGKEAEAIDALLKGILVYQELTEADEYGVRSEMDAVYQEICGLLADRYGVSAEEAEEINTYDNVTYTRRVHCMVDGTEFIKPGEEAVPAEPEKPQDILADEEQIISY